MSARPFLTREAAVQFIENCRAGGNYMAESYHDRVAARHAVLYFDNWSPPPIKEFTREEIALSRRRKSA